MSKGGKRSDKFAKNTANTILLAIAIFILLFVVTMIVTYWKYQSVPDALIQYTLGAGGIECLLLAGIKITKVIKEYGNEEDDDTRDGGDNFGDI